MPDITVDNQNFIAGGAPSSTIRQIIWSGLTGLYFAAAEGGVLESMDQGVSWGDFRPNATFGTVWPAGALAYQMAFGIGPRRCLPISTTPFFFAVNNGDQGDTTITGFLYKYDPIGVTWNRVSEQTFSGDDLIKCVASYGNNVVICTETGGGFGSVWFSNDDGLTFALVASGTPGDDWGYWAAYDSAGRLWLVHEADSVANPGRLKMQIYRSDLGDGSDLSLIHEEELFYGGSHFFGPNKLIACHPSNRNIIAVLANSDDGGGPAYPRSVFVTTDGGTSWTTITPPGQTDVNFYIYDCGDIVITPTRILVQLSIDEVTERHTYVATASIDDLGSGFTNEEIFSSWAVSDFGQIERMTAFGEFVFASVYRVVSGIGNPDHVGISKSTGGAFADFITWLQAAATDAPGYMGNMHYDPDADILWAFFAGGPSLFGSSLQDREFQIDGAGVATAAGVTNEDGSSYMAGPS